MTPSSIETFVRTLTRLLDRPVKGVVDRRRASPNSVYGRFEDAAGQLGAIVAFEVQLAALVGAALALRPAGSVRGASSPLNKELEEDFQEVVNVLGGWVNEHSTDHLVLKGLTYGPVHRLVPKEWTRTTLALDVGGYGKGLVAIGVRP